MRRMDGTRSAIEQLEWTHHDYGARVRDYECIAMIAGQTIATITQRGVAWSVRLCCVPYGVRGGHEVFGTYEEARGAVELWVQGLDIEPWPRVIPRSVQPDNLSGGTHSMLRRPLGGSADTSTARAAYSRR